MRSCSSRRASTVIVALRLRGGSASAASDVLDIPECPPDAIGSRRAAAVLWVIFDLLQRLHGLRERGLGGEGAGFPPVRSVRRLVERVDNPCVGCEAAALDGFPDFLVIGSHRVAKLSRFIPLLPGLRERGLGGEARLIRRSVEPR